MSRRYAAVAVMAVALVAAGCGSSKKKSSTATTPAGAAPATSSKSSKAPSRTYSVKLAGANEVPRGAPGGSGRAVISLRGKTNQLCWKFSALKGVTAPLVAHVHRGPAGTSGPIYVPLGGKFTKSGCTPVAAATLSAIAAAPKGYYVNVHNAKFPNGAVRAQL